MALLGSLNALPLEELLQLLAHKEGALEIWNLKDIPATTLYLKPGYIRSIDQCGKPLEALAARQMESGRLGLLGQPLNGVGL